MRDSKIKQSTLTSDLAFSLVLGGLLGLVTVFFFKTLIWVADYQSRDYVYVMALPFLWLILKWIKKNTLYFPSSVIEVYQSDSVTEKFWSPWGVIWNFVGTSAGHFLGASLGREGMVVTLSAQIAQLLKLNWQRWRPIAMSAGFATAVGHPLVAIIFMLEMFSTQFIQKIWALLVSWVACLVVDSFHIPHLFPKMLILGLDSWGVKIQVCLLIGVVSGVLAYIHKFTYHWIKNKIQNNLKIGFLGVLVISAVLLLPEMKAYYSLSLSEIPNLFSGQGQAQFLFYKYILTLLFVSFGFWGGEFVPSVLIGAAVGGLVTQFLKSDSQFGVLLGAFSYFAGLTNLKWTALFLALFLSAFDHGIWIYMCLSFVFWFSGNRSLYKGEEI